MYTELNPKTINGFEQANDGAVIFKSNDDVEFRNIGMDDMDNVVMSDICTPNRTYFKKAVQDYDGNWYDAVIIGDQVWMSQNLRTTHYADGTEIPLKTSVYNGIGYYNPTSDIPLPQRGYLYTWQAVTKDGAESENQQKHQGISPDGWHVPSDAEWLKLENFVFSEHGGIPVSQDSDTTGYRFTSIPIVKDFCSIECWDSSTTAKSPGYRSDLNNATGFNAYPVGMMTSEGFEYEGYCTCFATAKEYDSNQFYGREFNTSNTGTRRYYEDLLKYEGVSVRCIYDGTVDEFISEMSETNTYFENAVQDYDGNWYDAVIIGNQVWMAQNLRTTHYADGTPINKYSSELETTDKMYVDDVNSIFDIKQRGYYYNIYAALNGESFSAETPSGIKGAAPDGWHIPSSGEFTTLSTYLSAHPEYYSDGATSTSIAKSICSNSGWDSDSTANSVGNNQYENNRTGFNLYPTGYGSGGNFFLYKKEKGYALSTSGSNTYPVSAKLINKNALGGFGTHSASDTLYSPIRCVYDGTVDEFKQEMKKVYSGQTIKYDGNSWINDMYSLNDLKDVSIENPVKPNQTYFKNALQDYDGNWYDAVIIGDQVWMAQNLRTTHYADSTPISKATTGSAISDSVAHYYDNNTSDIPIHLRGYHYNYTAVTRNSTSSDNPSSVQGVAPNGWHIPSDSELLQLENFVSASLGGPEITTDTYLERFSDVPLGKALASKEYWDTSDVADSPGNTPSSNNSTGFNLIPVGVYYSNAFNNENELSYIMISTQQDGSSMYFRAITKERVGSYRYYGPKGYAGAVRCVYNGTVDQFKKEMENLYMKNQTLTYNGEMWVNGNAPSPFPYITYNDAGKIVSVNEFGEYVLESIPNAELISY